MSVSKDLFDESRAIPETGETDWGAIVTTLLADTADGLDFVTCRDGSLNIFFRLQAASNTLAASATLTPTRPVHKIQGNGGAVTLHATTAIADGYKDGQLLVLIGQHDTNTVTILNGANTKLNGHATLRSGEMLVLVWDSALSLWVEDRRNT